MNKSKIPKGAFDLDKKEVKQQDHNYYYQGKWWKANEVVYLKKHPKNKLAVVFAVEGRYARIVYFGSNQHQQNQNYDQWKSYWSRFNSLRTRQIKDYKKLYRLTPLYWDDWVLWKPKRWYFKAKNDRVFLKRVKSFGVFVKQFGKG